MLDHSCDRNDHKRMVSGSMHTLASLHYPIITVVASFVSYLVGGGTIHIQIGRMAIRIRRPRRPGHHD